MMSVIRSEWIKFRTIRMNWVLGVIAVLFPLATTVLFAWKASGESPGAPVAPGEVFRFLGFTSVVLIMLAGVMGASTVTSEFGSNTIRPTFAATPRRSRVVIAKGIVSGGYVAVLTAIVLVATMAATGAVLEGRDSATTFADVPDLPAAAVGLVVFTVAFALLGLAVGLLLKSTPGSVVLIVLWPLLVENLVGVVLGFAGIENGSRWLPYGAGSVLWELEPGANSLGRWGGGAYFVGFTLVLLAIGTFVTSRRDA